MPDDFFHRARILSIQFHAFAADLADATEHRIDDKIREAFKDHPRFADEPMARHLSSQWGQPVTAKQVKVAREQPDRFQMVFDRAQRTRNDLHSDLLSKVYMAAKSLPFDAPERRLIPIIEAITPLIDEPFDENSLRNRAEAVQQWSTRLSAEVEAVGRQRSEIPFVRSFADDQIEQPQPAARTSPSADISPGTSDELVAWIDRKRIELEPLADQPIGNSGTVHLPVARGSDDPGPATAAIHLHPPSRGYSCLAELRDHVTRVCKVELAVEMWQTFPEENVEKVRDLLLAMRWLSERLRAAGKQADTGRRGKGSATVKTTANPDRPNRKQTSKTSREPSARAWKIWLLRNTTGVTDQTELAKQMTKIGLPMSQGTVSRLLKQVEAFLKATGVLPTVSEIAAKCQSMDPAAIEMGRRQDHRTDRQRGQKADDSPNE